MEARPRRLDAVTRDHARQLRREITPAERRLWWAIRNQKLGARFRRQHPIGDYIVDFCCLQQKLVIEVDGGQHVESKSDPRRTRFLEAQGFRVLRFWNSDVMRNLEGVVDVIIEALEKRGAFHRPPS